MKIHVELSEGFLDRFPEAEREHARATAERLSRMIMAGMPQKQMTGMKEGVDRVDLRPYFDPDSVIIFTLEEGKELRLPVMTAFFNNPSSTNFWFSLLKETIKTHPRINDEAGNGTFASPLVNALDRQDFAKLRILSFNPNINPTEPMRSEYWTSLNPTDRFNFSQDYVPKLEKMNLLARTSAFDFLCALLYEPDNNRSRFEDIPELNRMVCRLIDHGAPLSSIANLMLEKPHFSEAREYLALVREHLDSVGAKACTIQDFKHAFAMKRLGPWFHEAAYDEEAEQHLMSINEQLPDWMQEQLEHPFSMLKDQSTWEEFVSEQPRTGWARTEGAA